MNGSVPLNIIFSGMMRAWFSEATGQGMAAVSRTPRRVEDTHQRQGVAFRTIVGQQQTSRTCTYTRLVAVQYAQIMFLSIIIIFFANVANALLRSEGDAKRAMYALVIGSILNIILDPIFIYTFDMGVTGAALATVISFMFSAWLLFYWIFIKQDTYVSFEFKGFKFKKDILKDIFKVGIPASVTMLSMSINMFILNGIIIFIGGEYGIAVFQTGWRVVTLAVMPLMGMAAAVTPITGAAFGMKDYKKLDKSYLYAIKIGLIMEITAAVFIFISAPYNISY